MQTVIIYGVQQIPYQAAFDISKLRCVRSLAGWDLYQLPSLNGIDIMAERSSLPMDIHLHMYGYSQVGTHVGKQLPKLSKRCLHPTLHSLRARLERSCDAVNTAC